MTHISYKGPSAAVADLMSSQVPVYFMNVTQSIRLVAAKKLRALGMTSPQCSTIAPDIPTVAEGGLKRFDMRNWYAMLVLVTTPCEIIATISAEVKNIRTHARAWRQAA